MKATILEVGIYQGDDEHDPIGYGLDEGQAYALVTGDVEEIRKLAGLLYEDIELHVEDDEAGDEEVAHVLDDSEVKDD